MMQMKLLQKQRDHRERQRHAEPHAGREGETHGALGLRRASGLAQVYEGQGSLHFNEVNTQPSS